jgi:hypothetical protein
MSEWIETASERKPEVGGKLLLAMKERPHVWNATALESGKLHIDGERYEHELGAFDYWLPIPPLPTPNQETGS